MGGGVSLRLENIKDYVNSKIFFGNANQFIKGDGSLDSNTYINFTSNIPNNANDINVTGCYQLKNDISNVPSDVNKEDILSHYNFDENSCIQIIHKYDANKIYYRNKKFGSWINWVQFGLLDQNVSSANSLVTKQLTDENLNNLKDINFSAYYTTNFSGSNKPSIISNNFGLIVMRTFSNNYKQIITDAVSDITCVRYFRNATNAWSSWKRILIEDDLISIENRLSVLEEKIK